MNWRKDIWSIHTEQPTEWPNAHLSQQRYVAHVFLLTIIIIFQLGLVTDGVSQQVKIDLHHFDIYIDQVNISA